MAIHSASSLPPENTHRRVMIIADPKVGKTVAVITTAPPPVLVLRCGTTDSLDPAKRFVRAGMAPNGIDDFDIINIGGFDSMQKALKDDVYPAVKKGDYKSLIVDDHPYYADRVEYLCRGDDPKEDYGKSWYQFKKRVTNQMASMFALPCHIIFANHYIDRGKGADGEEKQGEGKLPLYTGSLSKEIAGMFGDIVFMKITATEGEWKQPPYSGRVFVSSPTGAWTPGVGQRSTDNAFTVPADIQKLFAFFNKPTKAATASAPAKPTPTTTRTTTTRR